MIIISKSTVCNKLQIFDGQLRVWDYVEDFVSAGTEDALKSCVRKLPNEMMFASKSRIPTNDVFILIEEVDDDIGDLEVHTSRFSHLLYNKIIELGSTDEEKIGNLVVSGFSVSSVLSMLMQGADGTWSELVKMGKDDWLQGPNGSTLTQIHNCVYNRCRFFLLWIWNFVTAKPVTREYSGRS